MPIDRPLDTASATRLAALWNLLDSEFPLFDHEIFIRQPRFPRVASSRWIGPRPWPKSSSLLDSTDRCDRYRSVSGEGYFRAPDRLASPITAESHRRPGDPGIRDSRRHQQARQDHRFAARKPAKIDDTATRDRVADSGPTSRFSEPVALARHATAWTVRGRGVAAGALARAAARA